MKKHVAAVPALQWQISTEKQFTRVY